MCIGPEKMLKGNQQGMWLDNWKVFFPDQALGLYIFIVFFRWIYNKFIDDLACSNAYNSCRIQVYKYIVMQKYIF